MVQVIWFLEKLEVFGLVLRVQEGLEGLDGVMRALKDQKKDWKKNP